LNYGVHSWDIPIENIAPIMKLAAVATPFILISVIWSKTAFGMTLLRITDGWMKWTVWFLIVTTNIFLGLSILLSFIQCTHIQASWDPTIKGKCWDKDVVVNYHIFSGGSTLEFCEELTNKSAYSAAMDIILALLPWKLLWTLQMKRKERIGAAIAMSMGVL